MPTDKEMVEDLRKPAGKSGQLDMVVILPYWDDVRKIIIEKYKDKPDDYVLSIGHWEDVSGLKFPQFHAFLKISIGEIRSN